jgi:hypothetical protein
MMAIQNAEQASLLVRNCFLVVCNSLDMAALLPAAAGRFSPGTAVSACCPGAGGRADAGRLAALIACCAWAAGLGFARSTGFCQCKSISEKAQGLSSMHHPLISIRGPPSCTEGSDAEHVLVLQKFNIAFARNSIPLLQDITPDAGCFYPLGVPSPSRAVYLPTARSTICINGRRPHSYRLHKL